MSYGVQLIGDYCFLRCSALKSIVIPGSVKQIHKQAFMYCAQLSDVMLNDGLQLIGSYAFAVCNIKKIEIPKSVIDIKERSLSYIPFVEFKSETLPDKWICGICSTRSKPDKKIEKPIIVKTSSKTVFVPVHIKQIDSDRLKLLDADDKAFEYLYKFEQNLMSKILHAFYECVKHGFKDITESKYVARNGKRLADYLLKNKEEKDLVSLLQSGILSQNTLNYIYDKIPDDMTIARAYALENTGHQNTGFSL